jgi:hypothetical protein
MSLYSFCIVYTFYLPTSIPWNASTDTPPAKAPDAAAFNGVLRYMLLSWNQNIHINFF